MPIAPLQKHGEQSRKPIQDSDNVLGVLCERERWLVLYVDVIKDRSELNAVLPNQNDLIATLILRNAFTDSERAAAH